MRRLLVTAVIALVFAACAHGQERVAAYESLNLPQANQRVTFSKEAAQRGDRMDQTLAVDLQLESTVRKGNEQLDQSSTAMVRMQQRTVIADEVVDGRTVAARVGFAKADRVVDGQASRLPVVGNTYLCRRMEDDTLRVTRADGSFASPDEFTIVSESMQSLGRANPLADYLEGKSVAVGEALDVPLEVGAELLGSSDALGTVSKFELVLREVDEMQGIATFDVEIETQGSKKTQMRLIVTGELEVEVATCRTRRLAVGGPMGMATTTGTYSTAQTTYVRGKLKLDMTAEYN